MMHNKAVLQVLPCFPFTIPGTKGFQMSSKNNREYNIFVSIPNVEPPSEGFPVIYLLDGNSVFATAVEAMRVQSRRPDKTGIRPAVIVGIGYKTEEPFSVERFYDYTMGQAEVEYSSLPYPEHGGAKEFQEFIEMELKPTIEGAFHIDCTKQTIFGHSLGGLYVLFSLFTKPEAFQTYIAGSPSIHWNQEIILENEKVFTARLKGEKIKADLLISSGELEKDHPSNTVENTFRMAERLNAYKDSGLNVKYMQFVGEGHVSVLPVLINRSLRFSFCGQA